MIGRNRISQIQDVITLQYANGKTMGKQVGSARFTPYIGFHIEANRDNELDDRLRAAKIPQIEIKHQRPGGAEIVKHWNLGEQIRLFPVTSGPVAATVAGSLAGRNAQQTAEAGIGLRWGSGERSKMAVRAYLETLVKLDYMRLVQLTVRSRMTDVLLGALLEQARVCEAADTLIDRVKHPELVTFHEIALPLGTADEQEWGKNDTTTVVPFSSQHPAIVDADYLRHVWRPDTVHSAAIRDWQGIQQWAQEYAVQNEDAAQRPTEELVPAYEEALN